MQHYVSAIFRNQRIDVGICGKGQFISGKNQVQVNVEGEAVSEPIKKTCLPHFLSNNISPLKNLFIEASVHVVSQLCKQQQQKEGPHTEFKLLNLLVTSHNFFRFASIVSR